MRIGTQLLSVIRHKALVYPSVDTSVLAYLSTCPCVSVVGLLNRAQGWVFFHAEILRCDQKRRCANLFWAAIQLDSPSICNDGKAQCIGIGTGDPPYLTAKM